MNPPKLEKVFEGNGVSPGVTLGQALRLDSHNRAILKVLVTSGEQIEQEVLRVQRAINVSKKQLEILKSRLEEKVGREHSYILDVHLLMLEDQSLVSEIISIIRNQGVNAEWAVQEATERLRLAYASLEDEYFRERGSDIENVVERLLLNLSGRKPFHWKHLPSDVIVVSHDFNPSTFATMDLNKVLGIALESGGRTSHTAIIARSLRLPAIMELDDFLKFVSTGDVVLLNGDEGQLIVNPSPATLERFADALERFRNSPDASVSGNHLSSSTREGVRILLYANTELPNEANAVMRCGADGIGLFRSEFLFFRHPDGAPSVAEQFQEYRALAQQMTPKPVAIRTLDAGADNPPVDAGSAVSLNPSMGLRGIRRSLLNTSMFCDQIEAILQAGRYGRLEIVLPMVSCLEEVQSAKRLIERVRSKLDCASIPPIPVGVMVEVPAAVLCLESLAAESDFFCVGTNDLIQYLLAVDRGDSQVSHLFQPLHPAVLQCLAHIAAVAARVDKPVRICGEMSANPFVAVVLLGIGFTQLSMNTVSIPTIRRILQEVTIPSCRDVVNRVLTLHTAHEITEYLIEAVSQMVSTDLSAYVKELRAQAAALPSTF